MDDLIALATRLNVLGGQIHRSTARVEWHREDVRLSVREVDNWRAEIRAIEMQLRGIVGGKGVTS